MRKLLFFLGFFIVCIPLKAQWQQIYDVYEQPPNMYVQAMDFYSEDFGAILSVGTTAANLEYTKIIVTQDGGQTWDSTNFDGIFIIQNTLKLTNDSTLFFSFFQWVYSSIGQNYTRCGIKRSFDSGTTWTTHLIDSASSLVQDPSNNIVFLNDSMGVLIRSSAVFFTKDYGTTWTKVSNQPITNAGVTADKFVLYNYGFIHVYDPWLDTFTSAPYPANCEGQVTYSGFKNQSAYRVLHASDGPQQGYSANNYSVLIIDELPFGDQRVIHFPNQGGFGDLELTENGIFLKGAGVIYRSWDDGYSFEQMPLLAPGTSIFYLAMINDTVGYGLAAVQGPNFQPNHTLWKTTNAGGQSNGPVIINSFIGGVGVDELSEEISLQVYPNPTSEKINIQSKKTIERVEIYNIIGEKIVSRILEKNEEIMDLSHCESGVYFIRAFSENSFSDQKIVLAK